MTRAENALWHLLYVTRQPTTVSITAWIIAILMDYPLLNLKNQTQWSLDENITHIVSLSEILLAIVPAA